MEKEHRYSKLNQTPENPFRKDMNGWYPNTKKLYNVAVRWKEAVGPYIAENTQLLGVYNDGVLYLACSSSVLGNELRLNEKKIIEKINSMLGPDYIQKFRYNNSRYIKNTQKTEENPKKEKEARDVTEAEMADIEDRIKNITDDNLKNAIRKAYINFLKYRD